MKLQKIVTSVFFLSFLLVSFSGVDLQAQDKKVEDIEITVLGNCGMCKERIERAAYTVRGVRQASWDVDEKKLTLSYRSDRTDQETIERAIAKVGHDTENFLADEETHANLHTCCVYPRDPKLLEKNKLWNEE